MQHQFIHKTHSEYASNLQRWLLGRSLTFLFASRAFCRDCGYLVGVPQNPPGPHYVPSNYTKTKCHQMP